ncbi:hypothetical protein D3C79_1085410 [compost metagenome]
MFIPQPGTGLLLGVNQALDQLGVLANEIAGAQQHRLGTAGAFEIPRVDRQFDQPALT